MLVSNARGVGWKRHSRAEFQRSPRLITEFPSIRIKHVSGHPCPTSWQSENSIRCPARVVVVMEGCPVKYVTNSIFAFVLKVWLRRRATMYQAATTGRVPLGDFLPEPDQPLHGARSDSISCTPIWVDCGLSTFPSAGPWRSHGIKLVGDDVRIKPVEREGPFDRRASTR